MFVQLILFFYVLGTDIESVGDAFNTFFQGVIGGAFGSQDSALPQTNTRPPYVPRVKGKSHSTSRTPRSRKRKFGLVFFFPQYLRDSAIDRASNKKISHLARCFY